jgi:hypothetical protein
LRKKANNFAENWQKSQKNAIITSTPGVMKFEMTLQPFENVMTTIIKLTIKLTAHNKSVLNQILFEKRVVLNFLDQKNRLILQKLDYIKKSKIFVLTYCIGKIIPQSDLI